MLTEEWQKRAWAKAEGKRPEVRLGTVDRYVGALKRLFNWAMDMEKVKANPAARVKLHRQEDYEGYYLSYEEEERLLDVAYDSKAKHLSPVIVLALATGMRKGEILGLEWGEVDLGSKRISLPASRTKGGKARYVDINADAEEVLREQLKLRADGGINYVFHRKGKALGEVKTAWRYAVEKTNLPTRVRFHDLRHTAISRLSEAGVPEGHIKDMFWAKSSGDTMIRRYAHLRPENR